jgi:hypothetical protein
MRWVSLSKFNPCRLSSEHQPFSAWLSFMLSVSLLKVSAHLHWVSLLGLFLLYQQSRANSSGLWVRCPVYSHELRVNYLCNFGHGIYSLSASASMLPGSILHLWQVNMTSFIYSYYCRVVQVASYNQIKRPLISLTIKIFNYCDHKTG